MREWKPIALGNVAEVQSGGTPLRSTSQYWGGDLPWYSSGELNTSYTCDPKRTITETGLNSSNAKLYPKGSLLIGMYDTAALKMSILDREAAFNQAIAGVKPNSKIDLKFIMASINNSKIELLALRRGVRQKNLNLKKIKNISIFLPPIEEQKRIVAILDEVFEGIDAAIANTEKNLANSRELFESYLNDVFTEKGKGWEETALGNEIDLLTGFAFKSKGYTTSDDGIPLLRGDNIVQGAFRWEDVKKWPKNDYKTYEKYLLTENDIVLAMDRTWVNAGLKYSQLSENDLPCLLLQRVARLRAGERLGHKFLMHLIGSSEFTRYVLSIQTGLGVPHISGKQISSFKFYLPPLERQITIAAKLDDIAKEITCLHFTYQQKLEALAELKQSLLAKAVSGELTADSEQVLKEAIG